MSADQSPHGLRPPNNSLWYRAVYTGALARLAVAELPHARGRRNWIDAGLEWARVLGLAILAPRGCVLDLTAPWHHPERSLAPARVIRGEPRTTSLDSDFEPAVGQLRANLRGPSLIILAGAGVLTAQRRKPAEQRRPFDFGLEEPDWDLAREAALRPESTHRDLIRALGNPNLLNLKARYNLACYLALTGFKNDALNQLEAVSSNASEIGQAATDPMLRSLRRDARFKALVVAGKTDAATATAKKHAT